ADRGASLADQADGVADQRHVAEEPGRPGFDANTLKLRHAEAHESVEPDHLVVEMGSDLALHGEELGFLLIADVVLRCPDPRRGDLAVRNLEAVMHRQHVMFGAVPVDDDGRLFRIDLLVVAGGAKIDGRRFRIVPLAATITDIFARTGPRLARLLIAEMRKMRVAVEI